MGSRQSGSTAWSDSLKRGSADQAVSPGTLVGLASPVAARRRAWREALRDGVATLDLARLGELRQALSYSPPAVVLLDASERGLIDPSAIPGLRRLSPGTGLLTVLDRPDLPLELSLTLAGVRGCCTTTINAAMLGRAVASVSHGGYWLRRAVLEAALENVVSATDLYKEATLARDFSRMLTLLTPRQREIVRLVGVGGSNKEIADRLRLSEKTVKAHLTSAFQKLGIADRLRLALLVNQPSLSYVPLPLTQAAPDPKRLSYWVRR